MEYLDVLTPAGEKTGRVKLRSDVHRDGDWHLSVHVWILNSKGELLMQCRSPKKDIGANKWDISYCGHVRTGSISLETALREGGEELGLDLTAEDLEMLFTATQDKTTSQYSDREFNDTYLIRRDVDIASLAL